MDPARQFLIAALALFIFPLAPQPARAHAVNIFATAERGAIHGSVYFPGGAPLPGAAVTAYGPDRLLLARAETDADGRFAMPESEHRPLLLVAETPDGHRAEFTLVDAAAPAQPSSAAAASPEGPELSLLLEEAVARQLRPLREQLDREAHRRRLQDILGGLGYIMGIAGLAMYWAAGRKGKGKG